MQSFDESDSVESYVHLNTENEDSFESCGYPKEVLVNPDLKYLCSICHDVLRQPCQNVCGHRFCRRGVAKRLETTNAFPCPQCEIEGEDDDEARFVKEVYPDNAARRDLFKQKARCINPNCTWEDIFKNYDKHDEECPHKLMPCNKCSTEVPRSQMETHLSSECPMRSSGCTGCAEHIRKITANVQSLAEKLQRLEVTGARSSSQEPTGNLIGEVKKLEQKNKILEASVKVFHKEILKNQELIATLERQRRLDREMLDAMDKKCRDIERMVSMSDINIKETELRISSIENACYDGKYLWKLTDFSRKRQDAIEGRTTSIYSEPFFTHRTGYKMCVRLYLNGDGLGKGTHLSLFFVLMRGQYDTLLPWPFRQKVTFKFIDQSNHEHQVDCFRPDPTSTSFKRPNSDMNIASGCPLFMPLTLLENPQYAFVRDDTAFIHISVDTTGLEIL